MRQVIAGDGIGHGDDRAFARRISESVGHAHAACNGRNVQDDAALGLHMTDADINAVVIALHVNADDAVEGIFGRSFDVSDLGDAGIVDKNVDSALLGEVIECGDDLLLIADVTAVRGR